MPIVTREAWLAAAAARLRPAFAAQGLTIPHTIRYAIAFPSSGSRGNRVGECWQPQASAEGYHTIIVRADIAQEADVLAVLVHEAIHASLPHGTGHGPAFRKAALALGLTGKMTATAATPALVDRLNALVRIIGPLPHGRLNFGYGADDKPKKQDTRMLKACCADCDYTIRLSRKWAEAGLPECPLGDHGSLVCDAL